MSDCNKNDPQSVLLIDLTVYAKITNENLIKSIVTTKKEKQSARRDQIE